MRGFILAAGFGTRLRPITDQIPKALVPVAGKPLLERSLNFLKSNGIDTIGVNSHYLSEQIVEFKRRSDIPFTIFHEPKIRGTGGALCNAREFLCDDSFVIVNVDIVCQFDLAGVVKRFTDSKDSCALVAFRTSSAGTVYYNKESFAYRGTVSEMGENIGDTGAADFIGIALYRPEFLSLLTEEDFSIVPVWSRALKNGMPVSVYIIEDGYWRDTGKPKDLADFHFDILDKKISVDIPSNMQLNFKNKTCINKSVAESVKKNAGPYCWIENNLTEDQGTLNRCIIYKDSRISPAMNLQSSLITPWGVFDLHV